MPWLPLLLRDQSRHKMQVLNSVQQCQERLLAIDYIMRYCHVLSWTQESSTTDIRSVQHTAQPSKSSNPGQTKQVMAEQQLNVDIWSLPAAEDDQEW